MTAGMQCDDADRGPEAVSRLPVLLDADSATCSRTRPRRVRAPLETRSRLRSASRQSPFTLDGATRRPRSPVSRDTHSDPQLNSAGQTGQAKPT